jgi:hypothetical protein
MSGFRRGLSERPPSAAEGEWAGREFRSRRRFVPSDGHLDIGVADVEAIRSRAAMASAGLRVAGKKKIAKQ